MLLKKLLTPQLIKTVVEDVEVYFVKLNWKQLSDFQDFANEQDKKELNEEDSALILTRYILERYVKDEQGDDVITTEDIENLPVSFCVELLHKFLQFIRGKTEEETKKN